MAIYVFFTRFWCVALMFKICGQRHQVYKEKPRRFHAGVLYETTLFGMRLIKRSVAVLVLLS